MHYTLKELAKLLNCNYSKLDLVISRAEYAKWRIRVKNWQGKKIRGFDLTEKNKARIKELVQSRRHIIPANLWRREDEQTGRSGEVSA